MPKTAPPTPGEILLYEFLEPKHLSQAEFARHIGWTTTKLSQIIKGKRAVSFQSALDLADVFGTSAQYWINLQSDLDLWHAIQVHQPKRALG